nr:G protein-coupled receptor [Proales similis]
MTLSAYAVLRKILGVYALLLIIVGTLTSFLSLAVCLKLRSNATFVFFAFLTLSNIFTLYFWNLENFLQEYIDIDLLNYSLFVCKFGSFVQFSSLQISAWILVLISLDQYLSVRVKHWRTIYFKESRPLLAAASLTLLILLLNSNVLFTFGLQIEANNQTQVICYTIPTYPSTQWMSIWGRVHLATYSVLPFALIALFNIMLISNIYSRKKVRESNAASASGPKQTISLSTSPSQKNKMDSMSKTIVFLTLLFIAMTLPTAAASFFFNELFSTDHGLFIIYVCNTISFSYHGLNFFIYFLSNKRFRSQFREIVRS